MLNTLKLLLKNAILIWIGRLQLSLLFSNGRKWQSKSSTKWCCSIAKNYFLFLQIYARVTFPRDCTLTPLLKRGRNCLVKTKIRLRREIWKSMASIISSSNIDRKLLLYRRDTYL